LNDFFQLLLQIINIALNRLFGFILATQKIELQINDILVLMQTSRRRQRTTACKTILAH